MYIDWLQLTPNFTPLSALLGGALIGLSATLLMVFNGRILGISGILGGIITGIFQRATTRSELVWRIFMLAGIVSAPFFYHWFVPLPTIKINSSPLILALAGTLVGLGTRYGGGCTSGHGVCGLARLSRRSLIATLCFMGSGFITTWIARHILGAI